ncbi:MAG: hypothetical protein R3A47_06025 [Polyangiales bacterium]
MQLALRGIMELHLAFERRQMVPAIKEADGFGPARVDKLLREHNEQRDALDKSLSKSGKQNRRKC